MEVKYGIETKVIDEYVEYGGELFMDFFSKA